MLSSCRQNFPGVIACHRRVQIITTDVNASASYFLNGGGDRYRIISPEFVWVESVIGLIHITDYFIDLGEEL